ncbi:MAG TPA: hypothetical protein PLL10_01090 [Elusimicrobiales bacterium]|nr:hypothetical protein [Elusimicrobiales bacterium]
MRSGLFTLTVMLTLGALSASAPKMSASKLLSQGLAIAQAREKMEASALNDSSNASASQQPQSLEISALYGDFEKQLEKMTPEERQMYREMSPQMEMITNPVVQKLLGSGKPGAGVAGLLNTASGQESGEAALFSPLQKLSLQLKAWVLVGRTVYYPKYRSELLFVMWAVPLCLMAAAFILLMLGQATAAAAFGQLVYRLSSLFLVLVSIAAAAAYLALKINLLAYIPMECWCAAVVFVFGGGLIMRSVDMNYPFWNYTVTSLLTPAMASCLIFVWGLVGRTGAA